MKCLFRISIFLFFLNAWSQVDYSSRWEDYFSYNHVVDFVKQSDIIYAITENAAFTYNLNTGEVNKTSSVNGLSGNTTSVVAYSSETKNVIIGYDNGLMEIIDEKGTVKRIVDIYLSEISNEKGINSFYEYENKLYLSMEFGVVVYNLINLEFEDTFFIGLNSADVKVNNIIVSDGYIYAASEDGIYIADFSSNLNDSKNWVKTDSGEFLYLTDFNEDLLVSKGANVYLINNNVVDPVSKISMPLNIVAMNSSESGLNIATSKQGAIYDINYALDVSTENATSFTISSIDSDNQFIYLGTEEKGVLQSSIIEPNAFTEIHPDGPVSNDLFSLTVHNNDLWAVYGKYDQLYSPGSFFKPIDHYNGNNWVSIPYEELGPEGHSGPWVEDLISVTVDPIDSDKIYVSSWGAGRGEVASIDKGGLMVIQNDTFYDFWHSENSGLTSYDNGTYHSTRIGTSVFDEDGNLWVLNSLIQDGSGALKKMSPNGEWSGHHLTQSDGSYVKLAIDEGNVWIGSRKKGLLVYNENGGQKTELNTDTGGLPDNDIKSIEVGVDGDVWIGTKRGLVVFSDVEKVFSEDRQPAEPVIIDEDGVASILLDGATINDILSDGAGNVWFATSLGGVLQTNSTGKTTLLGFNKDNSPLPSNKVLAIGIDETTGTIYFGTEKGVVSYKTGVASYGESLTDVYAYPNPALKQHSQISIVGKSSSFPEGTNVKILDVAGNLVFESNAIESQSDFGGKFVWDKTNLAGTKVASGVYIIFVYDAENSQTASAKIAIIN